MHDDGRPEWTTLTKEEQRDAAMAFLEHLVGAMMVANLDGTPEEGTLHVAEDITANDHRLVGTALGLAVVLEARAQARLLDTVAESMVDGLLADVLGSFDAQAGGDAQEAPEAATEAPAADGKVWPEDRR